LALPSLPRKAMIPADSPTLPSDLILRRILVAILRNREPGFHFPGNFLQLSFDQVSVDESRVSLRVGSHNTARDGQVDSATLGILADLATATAVRAEHPGDVRLATVSLQLQLFHAPHGDKLIARSTFEGFVNGVGGKQGVARVVIHGSCGKLVGLGTGAFMVLPFPAGQRVPPLRPASLVEPTFLPNPQNGLDAGEGEIYKRVQRLVKEPNGDSFIRRFWGIRSRRSGSGAIGLLKVTPHVGNRVGHVQGGVLIGFAEDTARSALELTKDESWIPTAIAATFLRPGMPPSVRAQATIVHKGRSTASVRVSLFNKDRQRVLDALLSYSSES
jgi:uncharacterized protein (TIGR00369 family)